MCGRAQGTGLPESIHTPTLMFKTRDIHANSTRGHTIMETERQADARTTGADLGREEVRRGHQPTSPLTHVPPGPSGWGHTMGLPLQPGHSSPACQHPPVLCWRDPGHTWEWCSYKLDAAWVPVPPPGAEPPRAARPGLDYPKVRRETPTR